MSFQRTWLLNFSARVGPCLSLHYFLPPGKYTSGIYLLPSWPWMVPYLLSKNCWKCQDLISYMYLIDYLISLCIRMMCLYFSQANNILMILLFSSRLCTPVAWISSFFYFDNAGFWWRRISEMLKAPCAHWKRMGALFQQVFIVH